MFKMFWKCQFSMTYWLLWLLRLSPPVDGSGRMSISRWLRWLSTFFRDVEHIFFFGWRHFSSKTTFRWWDSTLDHLLMSMSTRCRDVDDTAPFSMTQHIIDDATLDAWRSEYVGFWTSHIDKIFDEVIWPRTRREEWYHFWPDWPTGTLRVEFTRFA